MASQTTTACRATATELDERNPFLIKLDRVVRLTPNDRQALANACRDVRSIPADRYIARTGDRPGYVHLIFEGWAVRCQLLSDGSRQITAFLLPGDLWLRDIARLREACGFDGADLDSHLATAIPFPV